MAAAGLKKRSNSDHAERLVAAGLEMIDHLKARNEKSPIRWECRIGIHSGPVISGVVGTARCQFDIMGDNVNIASRVENQGSPMTVTITEATAKLLPESQYQLSTLGEAELKGKGTMLLIKASKAN
jgi:class 3 adenylate cyclase